MSKVVLFGSSGWAEYLHYCLTHDSGHEVVGFTVDADRIREPTLLGLPIVPFESVETVFPPGQYRMLVALSYRKMNRTREEKYLQAKAKGYGLISHVSSKAITAGNLEIGDNCLVLENAVVQPFVKLGNDVTICASSVVGHHSVIGEHAFVCPGSIILGMIQVGARCLIGSNATIHQGLTLEKECLIGMGVDLTESAKAGSVYLNPPAERLAQSSEELIPFLSWS